MELFYRCAANLIGVLHLALIVFVVGSTIASIYGAVRRRNWVRNSYFRVALLSVTWVVVVDDLCGFRCPLTLIEEACREASHQAGYEGHFLPTLVYEELNIEVSQVWYVAAHLLIAIMVTSTCVVMPARWPQGCSAPQHFGGEGEPSTFWQADEAASGPHLA